MLGGAVYNPHPGRIFTNAYIILVEWALHRKQLK